MSSMHYDDGKNNKKRAVSIEEEDARYSNMTDDPVMKTEAPSDATMHDDEESSKKRPIEEEPRSNKRVTIGTGRVSALSGLKITSPCVGEDTFQIEAEGKCVYISGLMQGLKEGLAIAAHQDVPRACTWSDGEVAKRHAEVRQVLIVLLVNADELVENLRKFSRYRDTAGRVAVSLEDLRDKLRYILGATWQRFMGVDFQGSGKGTIQCFSSYYTLVAS
jgi:hypothetical protein